MLVFLNAVDRKIYLYQIKGYETSCAFQRRNPGSRRLIANATSGMAAGKKNAPMMRARAEKRAVAGVRGGFFANDAYGEMKIMARWHTGNRRLRAQQNPGQIRVAKILSCAQSALHFSVSSLLRSRAFFLKI